MEGVVLAGGTAESGLQQLGVERVPLLTIGGETLAARTCRLLLEAGCEGVYLLAPGEVPLPELPNVFRSAYSGEMLGDMAACLKGMRSASLVLTTADMPLLTAEGVKSVMDYGQQSEADALYTCVERSVLENAGLAEGRTYKKIGGKHLSGGNIFYHDREWIIRSEGILRGLFEQRKDPMALAKFFGAGFVWKVISGSLTLSYAEEYLSKKLDARIRVMVSERPEIAADLDKAADLDVFANVLDPL
ncbi:MAG: nucleotidyltransferase family protein [bacterium]|nr:nucleotidyltransferase family protein [bacterium]